MRCTCLASISTIFHTSSKSIPHDTYLWAKGDFQAIIEASHYYIISFTKCSYLFNIVNDQILAELFVVGFRSSTQPTRLSPCRELLTFLSTALSHSISFKAWPLNYQDLMTYIFPNNPRPEYQYIFPAYLL